MRSQIHSGLERDRRQCSTLVGDIGVIPINHLQAIGTNHIGIVEDQFDIQIGVLARNGEAPIFLCQSSIFNVCFYQSLSHDILMHSIHQIGIAILAHEGSSQGVTLQVGTHLLMCQRHGNICEVDRTIAEWSSQVGVFVLKILHGEGTAWVVSRCIPLQIEIVTILRA